MTNREDDNADVFFFLFLSKVDDSIVRSFVFASYIIRT